MLVSLDVLGDVVLRAVGFGVRRGELLEYVQREFPSVGDVELFPVIEGLLCHKKIIEIVYSIAEVADGVRSFYLPGSAKVIGVRGYSSK